MNTRTKPETPHKEDAAEGPVGSNGTGAKPPGQGLEPQTASPGARTDVAVYDFGDDAGAGMEEIRREERKIPFLSILDPKSPQCKPISAGGVAGAKGGAFYNSATGRVYDGEVGIDFIPVYRDENYPEFYPRNEDGTGGGFVGIRAANDPLVTKLRAEQGKFGRLKVPGDPPTELSQTYYLYGLLLDPEDNTPSPVMIGFKSTQIGKYQGFITRQDSIQYPGRDGMVKPPLWSHVWHIKTRYEQKGTFSWFGYVIGLKKEPSQHSLLKTSDPLYQTGKALFASIRSGERAADYKEAATAARTADAEEEIPM